MKNVAISTALALALASTAPAFAQNTNIDAGGGKGLVVVDISNIKAEIAEEIDVNVEDLADINSVQVPVNAAANVCNLDVNAIASSNDQGTKSCEAENTSDAVNQAVQQQLG
ncbi:hypothetical protein [Lutibaculum baratangense]|uniref:Uncharacterized protein n=1 Tax=Lutibaculum baratangense AMV1 TaxID=631454 RepID=V4TGK0_9HYPH|nr:hypothetical protein [Lutibaculum baratangense]ESR25233.1 hypothetical protein N177_1905 [Lutibaculum baratangense AMV1]